MPGKSKAKPDRTPKEHWKDEPEDHDYPAAADYLTLLMPGQAAAVVVDALRGAPLVRRRAKDLLRASRLELLRLDVGEQLARLQRERAVGEHRDLEIPEHHAVVARRLSLDLRCTRLRGGAE